MTLRTVRYLGYRIPDLAWLTLRELEYFFADDDDERSLDDSDSAYSF